MSPSSVVVVVFSFEFTSSKQLDANSSFRAFSPSSRRHDSRDLRGRNFSLKTGKRCLDPVKTRQGKEGLIRVGQPLQPVIIKTCGGERGAGDASLRSSDPSPSSRSQSLNSFSSLFLYSFSLRLSRPENELLSIPALSSKEKGTNMQRRRKEQEEDSKRVWPARAELNRR